MSVLSVVYYPDSPLTQVAAPIAAVTPEIQRLAEDMLDTMYHYEGVGLAGPQVAESKRIIVLHEPDQEPMCLINPEISEAEGSEFGEEGCLSIPRVYGPVPRATRIRVRALSIDGTPLDFESLGFQARIIQHEMDHLDGKVFLDRVDLMTRQALLDEWREERERLLADVLRG